MGIPGLTSYINESGSYLEDYKLHDTLLLIDGYNISRLLYSKCTNENWAFGGDYDIYAQCVSDFFEDLFKCNVIPLVFINDAPENKKLQISMRKMREKIDALLSPPFEPNTDHRKILPLLIDQVFSDIIKEKNIRHIQCLVEIYGDIAVVAKILNCPILSCESDFYMLGSLYIPFHTFNTPIVKMTYGNGYMKPCKIYKIENLFSCFKGLNESKLVLVPILLDNNDLECGTFKNFFRFLNIKSSDTSCNYRQYCIDKILSWLSKYTLEGLITAILCRVTIPIRQKILISIEMSINGSMNEFDDILTSLGFSRDYIAHLNTSHLNKNFRYDVDINVLRYIEEVRGGENDTSEEEEEEEEEEKDEPDITYLFSEYELLPKNAVITALPTWFVDECHVGKYPTFIIDLAIRRLYISPIQIENYFFTSSDTKSFKILSVIIGILKSGINNNLHYVTCLMRNQSNNIVSYKLSNANIMHICRLPSLFDLSHIPLHIQKEIINNTLEIQNTDCINELPPEWRLYVGCTIYWIHQQKSPASYKCYLYSILISMLFNIIDSKIGKYRSLDIFRDKYYHVIEAIKQERKKNNFSFRYTMDGTFMEAYYEIDFNDCIIAAPFFAHHFEAQKEILRNPSKYDRCITHAFAEFQSCLKFSLNLNLLLGCPYPQIKVANFFNGTLLYNVSSNFKRHCNIEEHINNIFYGCPSLLRVFNMFLSRIKPMFPLM